MNLFDRLRRLSGVPGVPPVPPSPGRRTSSQGLGRLASIGETPEEVKIQGLSQPLSAPPADSGSYRRLEIPIGARGTLATLQKMSELAQEAAQSPQFVQFWRGRVRDCPARDYACMASTILEYVGANVTYRFDPKFCEALYSPGYVLFVDGQGDCFVKGTKVLLREGMKLVPIESLREGDEIWGLDRWSAVQKVWDRGVKKTWLVRLNNGSVMRLSDNHKVFVAHCQHHRAGTVLAKHCACPVSERKVERVSIGDLRPHDVVLTPERVDFGAEDMDPRKAWVEGLYISNGASKGNQFQIAGRDGFPREQQKRDVQVICGQLGIETTWKFNYIACKDADWTARMKAMGTLPWNKRALSLDLAEKPAREMLRGILADSGRNTNGAGRTFTTSSKELFLQTRVLLKMNGISCSERFISDHGSTSDYPIWRLGIRAHAELEALGKIYDKAWKKGEVSSADPQKKIKLLRVTEVIRDGAEVDCFDVATDDHYVWLPEADWTVSNCDDGSTLIVAALLAVGLGGRFVAVYTETVEEASHVYAEADLPGLGWVPMDFVLRPVRLGQAPPRTAWKKAPIILEVAPA